MPERNALGFGILFTMLAGLAFASMDSIGKQLTLTLPVLQVVWARYVVHTALSTGYLTATSGRNFLTTRRPVLQLLRGLCLLGASLSAYAALAHIPVADLTAIIFFSPVIITILSVIFLRERIGVHRIAGVVVGLIGVALIVEPGFGESNVYHLLALCGAAFNSLYLMLTRQLADPDESRAAQFHATAVGVVLLGLLMPGIWINPDAIGAALLLTAGAFGAVGHFLLLKALSYAPASLLSPYLYSQLLFATLYSRFWFGDPLRFNMVLGTALLVASGLYIWWRERVRAGDVTPGR